MKKAILAITLVLATGFATAACPAFTKYQCFPAGNGKMNCGCY